MLVVVSVDFKLKLGGDPSIFALGLLQLDHLLRMESLGAICVRFEASLQLGNLTLLVLRRLGHSR